MEKVEKDLREYPECRVYLSTPPVIPGLGTSGGFEMQLEARGEATLKSGTGSGYFDVLCSETQGIDGAFFFFAV